MSTEVNRLTVVFDDPELYRRLKVRAAEDGVPIKRLVEEAIRGHLDARAGAPRLKAFDWDEFDAWQAEADQRDAATTEPVPDDLSDVKHHLYGRARQPRVLRIAEERAEYDPR
jgi:hypothetical protein